MISTSMQPVTVSRVGKEHSSLLSRLPLVTLVTLALSVVSASFMFLPDAALSFEFDRAAIASGQLWRLITGHLTHWNFDHYIWDGIVFLVLGAICERNSRSSYVACLLGSSVLISLSVWCCLPGILTYRGLSGIDSALFALLAGGWLVESWSDRQWCWVFGLAGALIGLGLKIIYEVFSVRTLFVDSIAADFIPIALAHAVGACVGLLLLFAPKHLANGTLELGIRQIAGRSG